LAYGCELLGCAISAPRQIESIAIDSSAFTHVKTGVYNLSLSLRNSAAIDLAAPALELTLTDMQDQALVRRVLMPGEYSVKTLLGSRAELVANIPIVLRAGVAYEKISGYKLLAFYP
jgi:predicted secreted protein